MRTNMAPIRPTLSSAASSEYSTDDDLMVSFPNRPRERINRHNPRPINPNEFSAAIPMNSKRRVSFAVTGESSEEESIGFRSRSRSRGSSSTKSSESPIPSTKSSSAPSDSYYSKTSFKDMSFELTSGEDAKSSLNSSYTSEETSQRSEITSPTQ